MDNREVHTVYYRREEESNVATSTNVADAILIAKYISFLYGECKLTTGGKEYEFSRTKETKEIKAESSLGKKSHTSKTL